MKQLCRQIDIIRGEELSFPRRRESRNIKKIDSCWSLLWIPAFAGMTIRV